MKSLILSGFRLLKSSKNVDVNIRTNDGKTALDIAKAKKNPYYYGFEL